MGVVGRPLTDEDGQRFQHFLRFEKRGVRRHTLDIVPIVQELENGSLALLVLQDFPKLILEPGCGPAICRIEK